MLALTNPVPTRITLSAHWCHSIAHTSCPCAEDGLRTKEPDCDQPYLKLQLYQQFCVFWVKSQSKEIYQCEQMAQNSVLPHAFTSFSFFPSFFFCRFILSWLQILHLNQCYLSNIIVHRSVASHLKRLRKKKVIIHLDPTCYLKKSVGLYAYSVI